MKILKKYGNSGYSKIRINGVEGLAKNDDVFNVYENANTANSSVAIKLPHSTANISFEIKVLKENNVGNQQSNENTKKIKK